MKTRNYFLILVLLLSPLFAFAEPEVPNEYVKIFKKSHKLEKKKAAESLAWAGISSPELFDLIEKDVLDTYKTASTKASIDFTGWMIKALAFSGNEKYKPTLEKVKLDATHKKTKKYAVWALKNIESYKLYNPLIAPKPWPSSKHPTLNQRLQNMLNSGNFELMRIAAKRIHHKQNYDDGLLELALSKISSLAATADDKLSVDTAAWLCKAVAGSGREQYKASIEDVGLNAKHRKLRNYAKRYLKQYY
ncbi:MAG: hypothetical protein K6L73_04015 [Cellvibrionaceae bacterium]